MLYQAPQLTLEHSQVLEEIYAMRSRLSDVLRVPRRWTGGLRRHFIAQAIRGSNSIEGYVVEVDDAAAAIDDAEPLSAGQQTFAEIRGYRQALGYVLAMAGESGIDAGEQIDGPAVIVTLMMPAKAGAADDIGCGDPCMNGQSCTGIGDLAWFIRELEDRRVGLRELLGLPPPSTDHCGCACTSARRHVYLLLPRRGLLSAEASH